MKSKLVIFILIVIGLITAIAVYSQYEKSKNILLKSQIIQNIVEQTNQTDQEEIKNWKTYRDNNVGWEIKLPGSYSLAYYFYAEKLQKEFEQQIKENSSGINGNFYILGDHSFEFSKKLDNSLYQIWPSAVVLSISKIEQKPGSISMLNYTTDFLSKPYYSDYFESEIISFKDVEEILINGKSVVTAIPFVFEGCPQNKNYFIEKNPNNYIRINISYCFNVSSVKDINKIDSEVNDIIGTFKFTN